MGPLAGVKIIEIKGIGPGPFAGMLLADMGAEVIVVERSSKGGGLVALPAAMDAKRAGAASGSTTMIRGASPQHCRA